MVDEITCAECGNEFRSNLKYCPNCKCNVESTEPKKSRGSPKIFDHPVWGIIYLFMGAWLLVMGSEWYFQLIGLVFVGFGFYKFYKKLKEKNQGNALTILKERYSKGEITKEEFDKMKDDLV
jgi:uncharacterized membrane protein